MISIQSASTKTEQNICRGRIRDLEADFFDIPVDNAVMYRIADNRMTCGAAAAFCLNDVVFMKVHFLENARAKDEMFRMVLHQVISVYHPSRILMDHFCGIHEDVLRRSMFYPLGSVYCRDIEPWRYRIEDQVFDRQGNIINQGKLKDLPFGWFNTKDKGCGWIAAYNLLRMNGREHTMESCAAALEHYGLRTKLFGQEVFSLYTWLKREGLPVRIFVGLKQQCCEKMLESSSGILLYTHKRGGHYTAYRKVSKDHLQFYNAVYGLRDMVVAPDQFMNKYVFLPWTTVIYMPDEEGSEEK